MALEGISIKARLAVALGMPTLLLLVLAYATTSAIGRMSQTAARVLDSHSVIAASEKLLSHAVDMQAGMRGFLLAGNEEFLEPYEAGFGKLLKGLTELRSLVSDSAAQIDKLVDIERIITEWRTEVSEPAITLRRGIGDAKSMNDLVRMVAEERGAHHWESITSSLALFSRREKALMDERTVAAVVARTQFDEALTKLTSTQSSVAQSYAVMHKADVLQQQAVAFTNYEGVPRSEDAAAKLIDLITEVENTVALSPSQVTSLANLRSQLLLTERSRWSEASSSSVLSDVSRALKSFVSREQFLLDQRLDQLEQVEAQVDEARVKLGSTLHGILHSHDVLDHIQQIEREILALNNHSQTFFLSGNKAVLAVRNAVRAAVLSQLTELQNTVSDNPPQIALLGDIKRDMGNWEITAIDPLIDLRAEIDTEKSMDDMARLIGEAPGIGFFYEFSEKIAEFVEIEKELLTERQDNANLATKRAPAILITGVSAALIVLLLLGIKLTYSVTRPISLMVDALKKLATGDLASRVELRASGEIGEMVSAYNDATARTSGTMTDVLNITREIDAGTNKVSTTSTELASGVTDQVENAENVNQALKSISESTRATATTTSEAASLARDSRRAAERGHKEMDEMVEAMKSIENSSADISKILTDIDEIAFQTNLLSLNAAVEAARAGDAGRGFAVVAEEVRGLAQRSAAAARNSSSLIEQSNARSKLGVELAGKVGDALDEISRRTDDVSTLMNQVETASAEQTRSIENVESGVLSLSAVTQQNAGSTQELALAASETSHQVARVRELVGQFRCE